VIWFQKYTRDAKTHFTVLECLSYILILIIISEPNCCRHQYKCSRAEESMVDDSQCEDASSIPSDGSFLQHEEVMKEGRMYAPQWTFRN
jgi:hypothetical protein